MSETLEELLSGEPGPFLEDENSFFGQKRVNPSMKDAPMETDCGGAIITKAKMTYGEADALAQRVDLIGYPAFVAGFGEPHVYWRGGPHTPNRVFVGEIHWSIYSYLTTNGYLEGDPKRYSNSMEYLYDEVLKRLLSEGMVEAMDDVWRWFKIT